MTAPKLTKRQIQLLNLLLAGKSNAGIAQGLQITEHTVKVHIWRLFNRIDVNSRLEAAAWWRAKQEQTANASVTQLIEAAGQLIKGAKSGSFEAMAKSLAELEDAHKQVIA